MSGRKRDVALELYRCVLMFGIVLMHCCSQGEIVLIVPYRFLMACLVGFVFLSGYYGIRFSLRKVMHIVLTTFICSFIGVFLCEPLGFVANQQFWHYFVSGNWFVWAYLVLMALAPIFDRAIAHDSGRCTIPLLFVVFGWNFLTGMPFVGEYLPCPSGFGTHTFLMMSGVYLGARLFNKYQVERYLRGWTLYVPLIACGTMCAIGLSHYDSPVAFVFVACLFCVFKQFKLDKVGVIVQLVSPSILSVYLLHWSPLGLNILKKLESCGGGGLGTAFITATVLFVFALILDIPRRLGWWLFAMLLRNLKKDKLLPVLK